MNVKEFESNFGSRKPMSFNNFWLVYFLVDESGEIVYVGKTSSSGLGKRLFSHRKNKEFSSYFVVSGPENEVDVYKLEGAFISLIRPKYNKSNVSVSAIEMKYLSNWMKGNPGEHPRAKIHTRITYGLFYVLIGAGILVLLFLIGYPTLLFFNLGYESEAVFILALILYLAFFAKFPKRSNAKASV